MLLLMSAVEARSVQALSRFAMDNISCTQGHHCVDRSCCIPDNQATAAAAGIMHQYEFTPFELFHCVDLYHGALTIELSMDSHQLCSHDRLCWELGTAM